MHSRLTLDQQQHLHHHLQHLNPSTNFNHILEKCCCSARAKSGHQNQRPQQHQHLLQQTYQALTPHPHHHHHHHHHHHYQHHHQHRQVHLHQQQLVNQQQQQQQLSSPVLSVSPSTQQQQQQTQSPNKQNSLAHRLYHQYHHQTVVASVSSSCSAVAAASPSSHLTHSPPPIPSIPPATATSFSSSAILSPIPPTLSATASTMYRRHNNLSYCGVSNQDGGQNYQVQYVDTELYHSNSSQSQMAYPFCPIGDYQAGGQSYYSTASATNYSSTIPLNTSSHASSLPYIVPVEESLLLNTSSQSHSRDSPHSLTEVAFIQDSHSTPQTPSSSNTNSVNIGSVNIQGGSSSAGGNVSPDHDHNTLGNTNKIASATIKWLSRNYETAEGVSLPRSTLYNHYIQHCNESKIEPVNAASFGKLIRSVFSGLRTRRLGTRGNSKYHYYGIRIKPESMLNQILDEKPAFQTQIPNTVHMAHNQSQNAMTPCSSSPIAGTSSALHSSGSNPNTSNILHSSRYNKKQQTFKSETHEACGQFLGDGVGAIPTFPSIELDNTFDSELTQADVETFRSMYREHCESFLDAVLNLEFNTIEFIWRDFWRENSNMDECAEEEKYLTKTKLYLMCHCSGVQKFVREIDYQFYQNIVDVIIPDVLRSIPNTLTQAIRNFAKNMEIWLCESMIGVPERMVQIKSSAVSAFCQTLRRYTSLNHLAQAARAVLQNSGQITQMLSDLNRVDFHNVQEQAAWVCQCEPAIVQRLENDFKSALQQQSSLEQWAAWLQVVVESALQDYCGKPGYAKAARQFLLKWSFYSSMIIRDLTLRSASSFGSFHLIRLLYDEYMFYLVEHKIAEAHQKTAIAVICDLKQKEMEFDFGYQLEYIAADNVVNERGPKRMKHE
ncbi:DNA-binding protein RFX2 [Lucilia cuprina]|uniref:DNA-binding protein RFX2 n=1 Tax=Lucilia cuprina TaxID=7375 RepID=UPI001F05FBE6|nr:DNA-binding protein RFX2 [Lucilia cuprina]